VYDTCTRVCAGDVETAEAMMVMARLMGSSENFWGGGGGDQNMPCGERSCIELAVMHLVLRERGGGG
jgi:hypothetical protein